MTNSQSSSWFAVVLVTASIVFAAIPILCPIRGPDAVYQITLWSRSTKSTTTFATRIPPGTAVKIFSPHATRYAKQCRLAPVPEGTMQVHTPAAIMVGLDLKLSRLSRGPDTLEIAGSYVDLVSMDEQMLGGCFVEVPTTKARNLSFSADLPLRRTWTLQLTSDLAMQVHRLDPERSSVELAKL